MRTSPPRAAADALSAVVPGKKREPARFVVSRVREHEPAVPLHRGPIVVDDGMGLSAAARAILQAEPGTCRWVLGIGREDFAFCGRRATIAAAGALSWCQEHASLVYAPKVKPTEKGRGRS